MDSRQIELLEGWQWDMKLLRDAHYASAVAAQKMNYWCGVPATIFSVLAGTGILSMLGTDPPHWVSIILGLLSIASATLASIQTVMRYSERAEQHRAAGASFAAFSKEISQKLVLPPIDDNKLSEWMTDFRERWDKCSKSAPTIDSKILTKTLILINAKMEEAKRAPAPNA